MFLPLNFVFLYIIKGGSMSHVQIIFTQKLIIIVSSNIVSIYSYSVLLIPCYESTNINSYITQTKCECHRRLICSGSASSDP